MNNLELELYSCIKENAQVSNMMNFMKLTEDAKIEVGRTLIDQIYVNISEKYNDVDFESIPASHGKISTMKEFQNLKASIELLAKMEANTGTTIPEIRILVESLNNIDSLQDSFYQGFVKKNTQLIMMYNLLAMSLYCGTSLMIGVLVDYVNLTNSDTVEVIVKKKYAKSNSYLMIKSLGDFNAMVKNGKFRSFVTSTTKPTQITEAVISVTLTVIAVLAIFKIIPLIKELIYIFYTSRIKLSEAAEIQANFVKANLDELKASGTATDKTIRIQQWFADKLHQISNVFAVKYEKNERQAIIYANTKLNKEDVVLF